MRRIFAVLLCMCVAAPALADTLFVTEFNGAPPTSVYYQAAKAPQLANSAITIVANTSVQSAAFTGGLIRLLCQTSETTSVCNVQIGGTNPTATGSSMRMLPGQIEYFVVVPGDKLAVYQAGPI
jgi:hypothetical protein